MNLSVRLLIGGNWSWRGLMFLGTGGVALFGLGCLQNYSLVGLLANSFILSWGFLLKIHTFEKRTRLSLHMGITIYVTNQQFRSDRL